MYNKIWFGEICKMNGFGISEPAVDKLESFVDQLRFWNQKINLISRKDTENIWLSHILGSVSFLFNFKILSNTLMLDIGTGGGLPGIPIAILNPAIKVIMIDSIKKKTDAVGNIIHNINLGNAKTICNRVENNKILEQYKGKFDYIVARSVGKVEEMIRWSMPLLNHARHAKDNDEAFIIGKGTIILLKGGDLKEEVKVAVKRHPQFQIDIFPIQIKGIPIMAYFDKKVVLITARRNNE